MNSSDKTLKQESFLEELARKLAEANVPVRKREVVLTEVDELMSEGIAPESFGSPATFAQEISDALTGSGEGEGATIWSPENPKFFTDKHRPNKCSLFGSDSVNLNIGAVVVKLGLLRQDDVDPTVLAAIPQRAIRCLHSAPFVLTAVTAATSALIYRRRLRIPVKIGFSGRIKKTWSSKAGGLAMTGISTLVSIMAAAIPTQNRAETLVQSSQALAVNTALLLTTSAAFIQKNGRVHLAYLPLSVCIAVAAEGAALLLATRSGLARVEGRVECGKDDF